MSANLKQNSITKPAAMPSENILIVVSRTPHPH